jgi:hypothetical protein
MMVIVIHPCNSENNCVSLFPEAVAVKSKSNDRTAKQPKYHLCCSSETATCIRCSYSTQEEDIDISQTNPEEKLDAVLD